MFSPKNTGISIALLAALSACETYPATTSTAPPIETVPACPAYTTGPGAIVYRFPSDCLGMRRTQSGLRIIPLSAGDRSRGRPQPDATVVVNYEGFLAADGQRIDSSYARGESSVLKLPELIEGWGEVLQLMSPGDEWVVYIPARLAYGTEPLEGRIPANSDLIFRLQLEGYLNREQVARAVPPRNAGPDMPAWQAHFPWNPMADGVTQLESGVAYVKLETGPETAPTARINDQVIVHYEGRLAETSVFFDSSWSRGEPTTFPVGALIPGFTEALTLMRPGDRYLVHIPADLAYGERGSGSGIPPNSDLMFQINLLDILPNP